MAGTNAPQPRAQDADRSAHHQAGVSHQGARERHEALTPPPRPNTPERKAAEAVAARTDKGETVAVIAAHLNVSLATARRFLTNLALAKAVESGAHDKAWKPGTKEVVVHTVTAKA